MAYPILAANSTWYKGTTSKTVITQIDIADSFEATGSETETWNADVDDSGSIKCYLNGTVLTIAGNGSGMIAANSDSQYVFSDSNTSKAFLNLVTISGADLLDMSAATTTYKMFNFCQKLVSVDVSNWDVSNVIAMNVMFQKCESLQALDVSEWNVSNVNTLRAMFNYCSSLQVLDVSKWNVGNVTTLYNTFAFCSSLQTIDVSTWDVSKVTTLYCTFNKCYALSELNVADWNVSNVTNMRGFIQQDSYAAQYAPITAIDVSNWDVSNVTDFGWAFYGLGALESIDVSKWNVSKGTNFHHMFAWCKSLKEIDVSNWNPSSAVHLNALFHSTQIPFIDVSNWDVSKCENFGQMFEGCNKLVHIKGLDKWDTSNGKTFYEMFSGCSTLRELDLSSFDTRNAAQSYVDPIRNESPPSAMGAMLGFSGDPLGHLRKVTFGENFSVNGDGTSSVKVILPQTNSDLIPGADGNWYDANGNLYEYSESDGCIYIPTLTAATYYAVNPNTEVMIKNGTLVDIADAIRETFKTSEIYIPSEISKEIGKIISVEKGVVWNEVDETGNPVRLSIYADIIYDNMFDGYTTIRTVNLNGDIQSIGKYAFNGCNQLQSLNLPDSIKTIGNNAFYGCSKLHFNKLPELLESVGSWAFCSCTLMGASVTLPESLKTVEGFIFASCSNLITVTFEGIPDSINGQAFAASSITTINVPWAEGEVANAPWGASNATINYNCV